MADRSSTDRGQRVVTIARSWIGTPYHHQASRRGVGCDCLGLIRGIWREAIGPEPSMMPAYTQDWGDVTGSETLIAIARRYFEFVDPATARPGDVMVFRMRTGRIAKHCGVLTGDKSFIHAQERVPVCEVALSAWWRRRIVAAFRFPER